MGRLFFNASLVLIFAGLAGSLSATAQGRTPPVAVLVPGEKRTANIDAATGQVLAGVNRLRIEAGAPPLVASALLAKAAREFALYMAETDRYGHEADGRTPDERARRAGYQPCIVAENIAYQYLSTGFRTAELSQGLLDAWMDSPGHRANILDLRLTEIGVGIARSGNTARYYAVQLFGQPPSRDGRCFGVTR